MTASTHPDFDQLAQALATLLATWWRRREETVKRDGSPPKRSADLVDGWSSCGVDREPRPIRLLDDKGRTDA